jgi:glycerol kinase
MILAIDQGTSNTKALLVDNEGTPRARASAAMRVTTRNSNWVEQDPEDIWRSVQEAVNECLKQLPELAVAGIAISNQRETVVAWERKSGRAVAPAIVWQCRRSEAICERLRAEGLTEMLRARTGLTIDTLFSASKIRWLLENIPGLHERAQAGEVCFGTVDSWLIARLTEGRVYACDASNASRTQLLNLDLCRWDEDLLHIFGVPRVALPEVRDSSGCFGRCSGIARLRDVAIMSAMGDSHAAMAGHGSFVPGTVKATYGTGSSLMTLLPGRGTPVRGLATTIAWRLNGATQYALEGNIAMTGAGVAWVGEFLGLSDPVEGATRLANEVADSAGVFFVPAMSGLGAPHWDGRAQGCLCGLTRTSRAAHMARAAVEAIAFQVRDVFDAMANYAGCELGSLRADGGATRNDSLMQFQADVLGRPVVRSGCEDLSAIGAAWFAGLALGWWRSTGELERLPQVTQRFLPAMQSKESDRLYAGWRTAVKRARLPEVVGGSGHE